MSAFDWQDFLTQWSRKVAGSINVEATVPQEVIDSEWLGYPGATDAQLRQAEARLGIALPTSYRAFLQVSNGWRCPEDGALALWSTEEIDWFAVENQDWIDAWMEHTSPVPDEQYFVYGEAQDSVTMREEYLQTALQIGPVDMTIDTVYLLNPRITTSEGEWEAWYFGNDMGAQRYRSFQELMQAMSPLSG